MMNKQDNHPETSVSAGSLEGARRATGKDPAETPVTPTQIPNPEVETKAVRRRFSAKYKRSVLEQADRCTNHGDIGALLRREGLYSSHLTNWRRQREEGALGGLAPRKRGRKPDPATAERRVIAKLSKENERLRGQLKKAQTIIEVQKKLSEILEISMDDPGKEKNS
jgi:transposase-like protein